MDGKNDKRIYTLSEENPYAAVIKLGVPLILGMFIMVLYNLVDTYFIGLTGDDYQLAAVNLSYPVMMVTVALANMVGTGASSLIARQLGAGRKDEAEKALTTALLLTLIMSLIVMLTGLAFIDKIVKALGARDNTASYTRQYVGVIFTGTIFTMGNYIFGQLLRSEGSVRSSILGMITGTAANILLDPLFIFKLGMQIRGAAIATILGNMLGMLVSLLLYMSGKTILKPYRKYLMPESKTIGEIFWVGIPASLETLLTSAAYIVNNNLAVAYGELTVAAMGVAQKIMTIGNYIYQGFAAGVQPLMGYNYGAKNYVRMRKCFSAGLIVVTITELAVMLAFGLLAPDLIAVFTGSDDVIITGTKVLRTIMFILPFVGAVSMTRMSFQAMGKPLYAFAITLVRQLFLYIPLLLTLDHLFGFTGMLWAQPVTELIMMCASTVLMLTVIRGHEKATSL